MPIIALVTDDSRDSYIAAQHAGVDGWLSKFGKIEHLKQCIAKVLEGSKYFTYPKNDTDFSFLIAY